MIRQILTFENYLHGVPHLDARLRDQSGIDDDVDEDLAAPEPVVSEAQEAEINAEVRHLARVIRLRRLTLLREGDDGAAVREAGRAAGAARAERCNQAFLQAFLQDSADGR